MDKNLHDIEGLFRNALEDNEENPSQKAWDGVEKKLDKDNVVSIKKKYDLLKKVALLLVFLLFALSIYVWKSQVKNSVKANKVILEINNETKSRYDSLTAKSGTTTLQKSFDSSIVNKSNNVKRITESENKNVDNTILEDDHASPKKSLISITSKNLSKTTIKKDKIKLKKPADLLLSDVSKFSIQKKSRFLKRKLNEVVEAKTSNQIEDKQSPNEHLSGAQFGNKLPAIEPFNPKSLEVIQSNSTDIFATKDLLQNISLSKINPLIEIEKTIFQKPSVRSMKQSHFAITVFYSPDIAFYHFEDNDPGNSNNTNFENSETESYSSTLGALVDYTISKNWGLQSGITLATSNFNLESETLYAQPDNSGRIKYKLRTPLGDAFVLPSFRNTPNIGDSILSRSPTHTLQYLGIPLAVKYNFNQGKFSLNALGGITANFLTRGRISTELESGADNEIETTDKIHGLKTFYLSGLAGVGLDYNIYKKFSVTFSPKFRFALNSINSDGSVLSYPNSFGFVLGIKMKL